VKKMTLIATAADRLLGAIVPRASAAANNCPAGCFRQTCFCREPVWWDRCVSATGLQCTGCFSTIYQC